LGAKQVKRLLFNLILQRGLSNVIRNEALLSFGDTIHNHCVVLYYFLVIFRFVNFKILHKQNRFLIASLVELLRREETTVDLAIEAVVILGSLARGIQLKYAQILCLISPHTEQLKYMLGFARYLFIILLLFN
jgi:hypothetical protein